jgi:hypothetical protein
VEVTSQEVGAPIRRTQSKMHNNNVP